MFLDVVGYVDMFLGECPPMHKHGIIVTSSQEDAIDLWKSKDTLPPCLCRELLHNKGVSVEWKKINIFAMSRNAKTYLLDYWSQKGLLDDDTRVFFTEDVEKMSFLIFMDTKHHVHNLVVV
jgi:hypothetical protein